MKFTKKGDMSIGLIITAAIALLILVILAVMILRAGTGTAKGTGCAGTGGTCADSCSELDGLYANNLANSGVPGGCKDGESCCVPISVNAE